MIVAIADTHTTICYLFSNSRLGAQASALIDKAAANGEQSAFQQSVSREQIPDLPDRVIAATALLHGVPVLTRDHRIRSSILYDHLGDLCAQSSCNIVQCVPAKRAKMVLLATCNL